VTPRASALSAPTVSPERTPLVVWLCFECDRFQRSPSPCLYCGSPCEELETPPGALKGKTLLEVFTERGELEEGDELYADCPQCGERWCMPCETHWGECSCPGPHDESELGTPAVVPDEILDAQQHLQDMGVEVPPDEIAERQRRNALKHIVSRAEDAEAALLEYIEADPELSMLGEAGLREIASWKGTGQKGSWQREQGESSRHSETLCDLFNERDDALSDMEAAQ